MDDWYGTACRIIREIDATLPADADLVTRREACIRGKPWEFGTTSWGRKTWGRAQREYLARFGYVPKTKLPESPLERAMRRARA